jgi:polysaccharide export outer membrane protein
MGTRKPMFRVPLHNTALALVARLCFLPSAALLSGLALSGCMQTASPVAIALPQNDLDAMAYGAPDGAPAQQTADSHGRGALAALRDTMAFSPRAYVATATAPEAHTVNAAASLPVRHDAGYKLDAGDKLRVVVFGQEGLTNTYAIDAGGSITLPLIGQVSARGRSPAQLAAEISAKLRNGYIREPSVAVEVESYRPFFILGEVQAPGQYPYVPNMTVESAVAIAGGFSPRAKRDVVTLTHTDASGALRSVVPLGTSLSPGDTVDVGERWF